jgi:putative colanic acid biosynthesis UDP-glucose lipid carrier transferase
MKNTLQNPQDAPATALGGAPLARAEPLPISGADRPGIPRGLMQRLYPLLTEVWQALDALVVGGVLYALLQLHGIDMQAEHVAFLGLTAALMMSVYSWSDLFYRLRTRTLVEEGWRLMKAWGLVLIILMAIGFLIEAPRLFPRNLMLTWAFVAFLAQYGMHIAIRASLHSLRQRGYNIRHALIVGCGAPLRSYASFIAQNPWLGIRMAGYVAEPAWLAGHDGGDNPRLGSVTLGQLPAHLHGHSGAPSRAADEQALHLGELKDVGRLVAELSISEIYVTLPLERSGDAQAAMRTLVNIPVNVNWVPDFSLAQMLSTRVDSIDGRPLVLLSDSRIDRHGQLVKRIEDILLSSFLLLLLAPLMVGIAFVIKRSSPGPVLFYQQRHGLGGRPIVVWKFRTMRISGGGEVRRQATAGDDRVTRIGRWLRRWSLDELPQLFNVLQGRMSIVGPRPHPLWLNDQFSKTLDAYMQRHRVKPGLTGWAQVHGLRGETDTPAKMEERVKYDIYYITHWSPLLDIEILARTVPAVVLGKNAC